MDSLINCSNLLIYRLLTFLYLSIFTSIMESSLQPPGPTVLPPPPPPPPRSSQPQPQPPFQPQFQPQPQPQSQSQPQPVHYKITRGHSCILCQQRKVRCDRQKPQCSNCVKAHAECITSTPAAPRRRRRKFSELDVAAKMRKYEHLLRVNGIRIDDDDGVTSGGGMGSGSANASGTEDVGVGADADELSPSRSRQEKTPNPQTQNPSNKGKEPTTATARATGSDSNESQNGSNKHRCHHTSSTPHESLHGNHSMGCARGSKPGRGQLFSKHGNSRYIEKYVQTDYYLPTSSPGSPF
ncbi:hypothetical protein NHQ30_005105 [Ciborinia camelliae]|nr:hypothetical protein NHQ30_005105 [Ciborinia camelliae]